MKVLSKEIVSQKCGKRYKLKEVTKYMASNKDKEPLTKERIVGYSDISVDEQKKIAEDKAKKKAVKDKKVEVEKGGAE